MPVHPKCGKTFPSGERAGHCGSCCETFIGLSAFESHRVGAHGTPERRCEIQPYETIDPETLYARYGHWIDERGYWHYGRKLTAAEKAELFPTKDEAKA